MVRHLDRQPDAALVALIAGETGPDLEDALFKGGLVLSLTYSRAHDRAADTYGLALATDAGYDPKGLVIDLERAAEGVSEGPSWATVHPATGERIESAREMLGSRDLGVAASAAARPGGER